MSDRATNIEVDNLAEITDIIPVGFDIGTYDYVSRGWTAGTFTEVWTFKTGGSEGSNEATLTVIYDDVNKSNIVNVTKT